MRCAVRSLRTSESARTPPQYLAFAPGAYGFPLILLLSLRLSRRPSGFGSIQSHLAVVYGAVLSVGVIRSPLGILRATMSVKNDRSPWLCAIPPTHLLTLVSLVAIRCQMLGQQIRKWTARQLEGIAAKCRSMNLLLGSVMFQCSHRSRQLRVSAAAASV